MRLPVEKTHLRCHFERAICFYESRKTARFLVATLLGMAIRKCFSTGCIEPQCRARRSDPQQLRLGSLQSFDQIQVRESPNVTVHVGPGVGSYRYAADGVDSRSEERRVGK